MIFSRALVLFLRIVVAFLISAFILSCTQPKQHPEGSGISFGENSTDNYYIDKTPDIKLISMIRDSSLASQSQDDWKFPTENKYQFQVCLRDTATKSQLPTSIKFRVENEEGVFVGDSGASPTLLSSGCVQWTESIPYSFFSEESKYLLFQRTLYPISGSVYRGKKILKFLINPWMPTRSKGKAELYWAQGEPLPVSQNLLLADRRQVQKALRGEDYRNLDIKNRRSHPAQLVALDPTVNITKRTLLGNGNRLEVDFISQVGLSLSDINGDQVTHILKHGRFKVYLQLIATDLGPNGDKKVILTPNIPYQRGNIYLDGKLHVQLNAEVMRTVLQGRLMVALRLVPENISYDLNSFDGLYLLGHYDEIVGRKTLTLREEVYKKGSNFSFDEYLAKTDNFEELLKAGDAFVNDPYEFTVAKVNYERVKPGETATQRTIQFRVITCVNDQLLGKRVRNQQFIVYRNGEKLSDEDARTDEQGCLKIMGEVSHAYYKPEQLIPMKIDIEHVVPNGDDGKAQPNYKKELTIYTNPWDDKFTFGRDEREMSREFLRDIQNRKKIESRFFLSAFSYQTLKFGYEIDKYLNLIVKKMVLLYLEPMVMRYSGIVGGRKTKEPLRDGIYLLKVALEKDYLDPATKGLLITRGDWTDQKLEEYIRSNCLDTTKEPAKDCKEVMGMMDNPNLSPVLGAKMWDGKRYRDLSEDELSRIEKQSITALKKIVRVNNGKIITPIELSVKDIRLMRIRSQFLIQLEPIDEKILEFINQVDTKFNKIIREEVSNIFEKYIDVMRNEKGERAVKDVISHLTCQGCALTSAVKYSGLPQELKDRIKKQIQDKQLQLDGKVKAITDERMQAYLHMPESDFEDVQVRFNKILKHIEQVAGPEEADIFQKNLKCSDCNLSEFLKYNFLSPSEKEDISNYFSERQSSLGSQVANLAPTRNAIQSDYQKVQESYIEELAASGGMSEDARRTLLKRYDSDFNMMLKEMDVYDETKAAFEKNDFTIMPTAPVIKNIDLLIEPPEVSGLSKRTFIGPLTFLLQSNKSNLRPTDNLAENTCLEDDCNQSTWGLKADGIDLKSDSLNYRSSRFYGSIRHLTNVNVDDLFKVKEKLDQDREREFEVASDISNFINSNDLQFISLGDVEDLFEPVNSFGCTTVQSPTFFQDCMKKNNEFRVPFRSFIDQFNNVPNITKSWAYEFNNWSDRNLNEEALEDIIETGRVSDVYMSRLCVIMAQNLVGKENVPLMGKMFSNIGYGEIYGEVLEACTRQIGKSEPPIVIDRKLRVKKVGTYVFKGGKQMNVNVGSNVNFSHDDKAYFNRGFGVSSYLNFLGPTVGSLLQGVRMTYDFGTGQGRSESTTMSEQTFLVMQKATFDLEITSYQKCAAIKWNPKIFFADIKSPNKSLFLEIVDKVFRKYLNPYQKQDKTQAIQKVMGGYLICSPPVSEEKKQTPVFVRENYFYFTQHFTDGDMLDNGDLYNHPWLLALRGNRDAARFISFLSNNKNFQYTDFSTGVRTEEMWPIEHMIETYVKATPSFPGMYTILDDYGQDFPWESESPKQSIEKSAADQVRSQKEKQGEDSIIPEEFLKIYHEKKDYMNEKLSQLSQKIYPDPNLSQAAKGIRELELRDPQEVMGELGQ